ncbi:hypothetical protein CAPTEDRAFT_98549, partial [Capitella teleta]
CRDVHHFNASYQCTFVRRTVDCQFNEGFLDYIQIVYCTLSYQLLPLALTVMILWLTFLFMLLAITADDFFCPSLVVIKDTLRLSDNIAGVTLLAFGNGAPDVFSAISAVKGSKGGDMGMAFGALLGAGVFLTSVVAGSVACVKPFHAAERPFLRDIIFYLGTIYFTFYVIYYGTISLLQATMFLVVYAVYVIVVLVGRCVYQSEKRKRQQQLQEVGQNDNEGQLVSYASSCEVHVTLSWRRSASIRETASALSPLTARWTDMSCLTKGLVIYKTPGVIILRLAIPVVDEDRPNFNWSRPLNSLQCLISPIIAIFLANPSAALYYIGGMFPVWALVMVIGCVLGIVVFFTSTNEDPPKYHWAFAYLGFLLAVIWIQAIANEIVNILRTFGLVMSISDAILGLTLLAWGNSIGDFVSDIVMARQNRARIGMSACFGGPLFNSLIGVGIPFTLATYHTTNARVMIDRSPMLFVLISGVFLSLCTSLVVAPLMRFKLNKYYGFLMFGIYAIFLVFALLTETGVISLCCSLRTA